MQSLPTSHVIQPITFGNPSTSSTIQGTFTEQTGESGDRNYDRLLVVSTDPLKDALCIWMYLGDVLTSTKFQRFTHRISELITVNQFPTVLQVQFKAGGFCKLVLKTRIKFGSGNPSPLNRNQNDHTYSHQRVPTLW